MAQRFASWRPAIEQALFEHYEPYSEAVTASSVGVFCFHEDGALNLSSFHRAAATSAKAKIEMWFAHLKPILTRSASTAWPRGAGAR